MGQRGPLDHPELREIERLLDQNNVVEAQRRLAELDALPAFSDGVAFLSVRLLFLRGRLDPPALSERLRELLARSPAFPEAVALLERTDRQKTSSRPPAASMSPRVDTPAAIPFVTEPTAAPPATPPSPDPSAGVDTTAALNASWPPRPPSAATVRATPKGPGPMDPPTEGPPKEGKPRSYKPVTGFEPEEPAGESVRRPHGLPEIPRAPAIPNFRENSAPPSYVPGRHEPDHADPIRAKSLLPRDAGRYSEMPRSTDVVEPHRLRPSRAAGPAKERVARDTVGHTPEHRRHGNHDGPPIRSGRPPESPSALPTLFEIASWIDEGRHHEAIEAINRAGPDAGAEYAVLRARALAAAGYAEQAFEALEQLGRGGPLEPELSGACARLYVELGDPGRALQLSKRALDAAPDRPLVRLTYALAAVRTARRHPDDALLEQAARALDQVGGREGPLPALHQALKACVLAGAGDAERAISVAQRALGLDPRSPDALAAIAEASARAGRVHDARQAWSRIAEISPDESEALAGLLARLGVPTAPHPEVREPKPETVAMWADVETALGNGRRVDAMRAVETSAHETVHRMSRSASQSGLTAIATVAATFLTTAPVLSCFVPFDASLWSIRRLDAALNVLYGPERRPALPTDDASLVLLLGSYLGESLRLAHDGHWEGRLDELEAARVVVQDRQFYPFRIVTARLHHGRRASLSEAVGPALTGPGTPAWTPHLPNPVSPRVPWAPSAWPRPSQVGAIALSIAKSPIGRFCEEFAEGPLDGSTASFIALDSYLEVIAPRGMTVSADTAWARRAAVLAGSYVGETLRLLIGGDWVYGIDAAEDALAFRLRVGGAADATPIAHVLDRVSGTRVSSLVDYAKTLMRRAGR